MPNLRTLSREKIFYVYALLDTRKAGPFYYGHWKFSHEPFYIGKGKNYRALSHLSPKATGKHNPFKHSLITKIRRCTGDDPTVAIKKTRLTEKQALELETILIDKIGRRNVGKGPLTNLTDGGLGSAGVKLGTAAKKRLSAAQKARWAAATPAERKAHGALSKENYVPWSYTDEQRAAMSKLKKKQYKRKELRDKISKAITGVKHPQWRRDLKSLVQTGVKTGPRSEEAKRNMSEAQLKLHSSGYVSPRKGMKETAEQCKAKRERNFIKVEQFDVSGRVRIWESPCVAQEKLGVASSSIVQCCKGRRKTAGGFYWKYV